MLLLLLHSTCSLLLILERFGVEEMLRMEELGCSLGVFESVGGWRVGEFGIELIERASIGILLFNR